MDNRKLIRMQFKSNVELINNDISIKGVIKNISVGGMFVETAGLLNIDTNVDVTISLGAKNELPLKLKGVVKRQENNGLAVEFTDQKGLTENLSNLFISNLK